MNLLVSCTDTLFDSLLHFKNYIIQLINNFIYYFQPAHVKACFLGSSITVPITEGKLNLGTWQGIWLCEHRNQAGSRKLVITLNGSPNSSAGDCNRSPMSPSSPMASLSSQARYIHTKMAVIYRHHNQQKIRDDCVRYCLQSNVI